MPRTRGAINRTHVRIVDAAAFATVVRAIADDVGGPAALAAQLEVSKALISNWLAGTRSGMDRRTFQAVAWCAAGEWTTTVALFQCVARPADGGEFFPAPALAPLNGWQRFRRCDEAKAAAMTAAGPEAFLEDVLPYHAERIRRGERPPVTKGGRTRDRRDPLEAWPLWQWVLVPPPVVEFVRQHWVGAFECDAPRETERGERVPLMLWGELEPETAP
jgi:hypothetical protein